jgi:ADP-heptose:LPS heptosyltransferase
VIDLHSLYETNILGFLSGARHRLFANRENRSLDALSNFRPSPPKQDKGLHLSSYYLDVLKPLGITKGDFSVRVDPARFEAVKLNGKALSRDHPDQKQVGLFVGSGHQSRRWRLSNFAILAEKLAKEINAHVSVFLGPAEQHLEVEVKSSFPPGTSVMSGLTLSQLAANLSEIDVLISNDTGPMHLGAIVGTSIVLILDDRAPRTYLPLTNSLEIVGGENLDQISVDDVLTATLRQCENPPAMG